MYIHTHHHRCGCRVKGIGRASSQCWVQGRHGAAKADAATSSNGATAAAHGLATKTDTPDTQRDIQSRLASCAVVDGRRSPNGSSGAMCGATQVRQVATQGTVLMGCGATSAKLAAHGSRNSLPSAMAGDPTEGDGDGSAAAAALDYALELLEDPECIGFARDELFPGRIHARESHSEPTLRPHMQASFRTPFRSYPRHATTVQSHHH